MFHPFFKNHGPISVSEIVKYLNIKIDNLNLDQNITDIKDGRKPNTLVATIKSHCLNVPTLLIEHL